MTAAPPAAPLTGHPRAHSAHRPLATGHRMRQQQPLRRLLSRQRQRLPQQRQLIQQRQRPRDGRNTPGSHRPPTSAPSLADYRSGKKQQAYTLAKSVSAKLYEGTTEGIVSRIDPAGERQIDSLLAATIPAAIQNGEAASQVAVLIHRGQALAASCLAAIHKSESGGG